MPTFIFIKNKVKIDELRGADGAALEAKIKKYVGDSSGDDNVGVPGHVSLFLSLSRPVNKQVLRFNEDIFCSVKHPLPGGIDVVESPSAIIGQILRKWHRTKCSLIG